MKYLITVIVLLSLGTTSYAQLGEMTQAGLKQIQSSTTYFVLDEEADSKYNIAIKENARQFWKLTPFEFIPYSQLKDFVQKPNTSFVLKLIYEYNSNQSTGNWAYQFNPKSQSFENGFAAKAPTLSYRYDGIVLVLGGKKKAEFSWNDWMAYSCVNDVTDPNSYIFKMGAYLQVIQNFSHYLLSSGGKNISFSQGKEAYNMGKIQLKDKLLYIRQADLPEKMADLAKIKEAYKYGVKFATDADIQAAIRNQDTQVVLLHHTTTGNRYYPYLTETKTGKVLYLDMDRNYLVNPAKSVRKFLQEVSQ